MGQRTGISWTDHTFNPWWGCVRVSEGCRNCYAASLAERYGFDLWRAGGERRFFSDKHWRDPLKWNEAAAAAGRRARVFCASMADVFEDHPALEEPRHRLFRLIEDTPHLDWQVLTKRADRMRDFFLGTSGAGAMAPVLPNLWLGVSVEDQATAHARIPALLDTPAAVRFLSCEPLLGQVDLSRIPVGRCGDFCKEPCLEDVLSGDIYCGCGEPQPSKDGRGRIGWVIVGGESGRGARAMDPAWVGFLARQCDVALVPMFFKQWGTVAAKSLGLKDPKGGDPEEWPADLRDAGDMMRQEFPR